ncbi:recombinase family protein [Sphingobium subterraneum]|nr:recombinase family protein [Sphingobium subterraneum]
MRAASYVRMSTDHQRYSTENQADAIKVYAEKHGMVIVREYADEGKSGLNIGGRDAFGRMIDDVRNGVADFEVIIAYDITRWGRFQDADESASYEYICRRAGIPVLYCAEPFENDGTPTATIMKNVKRAMAALYSRDLSNKVFVGQCRLIGLGYRQGGAAGFGLRRLMVDDRGDPKAELAAGERKSLQTDRVILVPGPPEERAAVERIFRSFVELGRNEREIATALNRDGIVTDLGRPWTRGTVHQILTNEKYVGNNVFNKVSFKLKERRVRNPPEEWVRAKGAFKPLVEQSLFERAGAIIAARSQRLSDDEMLALLQTLFGELGMLSGLVIDEQDGLPSSSAYRSRFGSLLRVYALVGYRPRRDYRYVEINRALRRLYPAMVGAVLDGLAAAGGSVRQVPDTDLIWVNDEFSVSVVIARCKPTIAGSYRWRLRFDTALLPDVTVVVRMDVRNERALDYYLLPRIDVLSDHVRLAEDNGLALDGYRFADLDTLYSLATRVTIREAA